MVMCALLFVQDLLQRGGDFLGSWAAGRASWALHSGLWVRPVVNNWGALLWFPLETPTLRPTLD